jgi:RimJ/RimL family protein N-acetyltransferase
LVATKLHYAIILKSFNVQKDKFMIQITPEQLASLKGWFVPDRPGPLVGLHVLQTGNGTCFVDRWPDPRAILVNTAGNYSLAGDPAALEPADLKPLIVGFVEAPQSFVPLLEATFPDLIVWDRIILELKDGPLLSQPVEALVRRLEPADKPSLDGLGPEVSWVGKTWGGAAGLAASGMAWGAFVEDRLVSVACTFFVGEQYEEIGVATEPEFRGLGFSVACAGGLCADIRRRGRYASWTTSPDNTASLRVAEKLGFALHRRDYLYVIGHETPAPPQRPGDAEL